MRLGGALRRHDASRCRAAVSGRAKVRANFSITFLASSTPGHRWPQVYAELERMIIFARQLIVDATQL